MEASHEHSILTEIYRSIITALLAEGILDTERLSDKQYVRTVVSQNAQELVPSLRGVVLIENDFLDSAREAVNTGRIPVAVVLVATTVEHKLNGFYRDLLENAGLTSEEATDAISSNMKVKTGWLMTLVTGHDLSEGVKKRIRQVNDIRNGFVHYKAHADRIDEMDNRGFAALMRQVEEIGIESILELPHDLETELHAILLDTFPSIRAAFEVTELLMEDRA
jgi:hypothetical protein